MPNQYQLRRRRDSRDPNVPERSPAQEPQGSQRKDLLKTLKPVLLPVLKITGSLILGLSTAASFSRISAAIFLFAATLLAGFISLLWVFMSILREKDQTPVYMPDVHNPDGTVVPQQQMTVFEHDDKVAKYFCRELPGLALATVWFYLWSLSKPTFAVYTAFVAFRILFHPLFRLHVWKEPPSKELGRPFGAVPLFDKDSSSKVKVIEGDSEFQQALQKAKNGTLVVVDCSATWCAPCKQMAPVFEKVAEEFGDHTFVSIDVDISRDVAASLAITSVPSFVIFKGRQRMEMLKGASPQKLRDSIQSYL